MQKDDYIGVLSENYYIKVLSELLKLHLYRNDSVLLADNYSNSDIYKRFPM